jgi:hypothetical protein
MASEIRVNQIQNRSGLSTVTFSDTGVVVSGITTITDLRASGNTIVAAGSTSAPSISPTGDSNTGIFFPSADTIAFAEGGVEAARFDSSGNFGIGTINPQYKLDISGGSQIIRAGGTLYLENPGTGRLGYLTTTSQGTTLSSFNGFGEPLYLIAPSSTGFISLSTAGSEKLNIDSSGRVRIPYQPAFHVPKTTGDTLGTSASKLTFSTATYDVGSNYSDANDRFTAPVAGKYFFYCSINVLNSGNFTFIQIRKNGNLYGQIYFAAGNHPRMDFNPSGIIDLAVSDYVEVWGLVNTGTVTVDNAGYFGGYLLG